MADDVIDAAVKNGCRLIEMEQKMRKSNGGNPSFIYLYSFPEEEEDLCALEMRAFFGEHTETKVLISKEEVEPSRSPFIRGRLEVISEAETISELAVKAGELSLAGGTFKVVYIKYGEQNGGEKIDFQSRRKMEKEIGLQIKGVADLHSPDSVFGILRLPGRYVLGEYVESESTWFRHQKKPRQYSTALSTRLARAVMNIAVPVPESSIRVIDPCCGIGTVLVEGLSMGIRIDGSDRNPLVVGGARENIAHFGLEGEVRVADIHDIDCHYEVAIVDLPYNLCSVMSDDEKLGILKKSREIADKVVVITTEPNDFPLLEAGFSISDRAVVKKGLAGSFTREIIVCN